MIRPWMKPLAVVLSWTMILFSLPVRLGAQTETRQTDVGGVTVEQTIQGEGKLVIAVLDLEGRGISALEAATLTDRMRSELVATGAVTIRGAGPDAGDPVRAGLSADGVYFVRVCSRGWKASRSFSYGYRLHRQDR